MEEGMYFYDILMECSKNASEGVRGEMQQRYGRRVLLREGNITSNTCTPIPTHKGKKRESSFSCTNYIFDTYFYFLVVYMGI